MTIPSHPIKALIFFSLSNSRGRLRTGTGCLSTSDFPRLSVTTPPQLLKRISVIRTSHLRKIRNPNIEIRNKSKIQNSKLFCLKHSGFEHSCLFRISCFEFRIYLYINDRSLPERYQYSQWLK